MPSKSKVRNSIIDQLEHDISDNVGNQHEDELNSINDTFTDALNSALRKFNSTTFNDDGFIKHMQDLSIGEGKDKDMMKHVLNNIKSDYVNAETVNQSELLIRRDISNICTQMPEMRDVINVIRDGIIECNVATGQVSRDLIFENKEDDTSCLAFVKDIEKTHNLLSAIKNYIVPKTLEHGERYVHVVPYAKLFAEVEAAREKRDAKGKKKVHKESYKSLYNDANLSVMMESIDVSTKVDVADESTDTDKQTQLEKKRASDKVNKESVSSILKNINIYNEHSELFAEMGADGLVEFLSSEIEHSNKPDTIEFSHFMERGQMSGKYGGGIFRGIDPDDIDFSAYKHIKGCYIKYLDGLKLIPIRMDRRIIGYYYATTTTESVNNAENTNNGMIDLSYQNYTKDKNVIDSLTNIIVNSFDKSMLEKNIKLKSEIADILMAHKFSEGRLSFIYIPENEVIRFVVNEDENGRGHSVLEPSLFPARNYLMLSMYNMLYILNNHQTRVYYLKSSGLNKNYASQVQRKIRKFQSRRITIDDIYSYSGALNKVGARGEMLLPAGKGDYKAFDVDTIEAANTPIDMEFLESQRKLAISGTGVPHLMMINAIDEADFAKSLEMANSRFLSTVSSYKIDMNDGLTRLYRLLLKHCTELEDDVINSFLFKFNQVKQQELSITSEMITNFESMVELVETLYYKKSDLEDDKGNATYKRMILRRELAKEYLPQLDFDRLEEVIKRTDLAATDEDLQDIVSRTDINEEDLKEVEQ